MSAARALTLSLGGRWRGGYGLAKCPSHDDRTPSLSISDAHGGKLLVHCHAGCDQPTVIAALRARGLWDEDAHVPPWRPRDTIGVERSAPGTVQTLHPLLSAYGRQLWASCQPITPECQAGRYLSVRGCTLPHPEGDLRWHPALKHPCGHVGPALVALVTDVRDAQRWLTLHRTWIGADGEKADVSPPRILLKDHRKSGGCIRLWSDCDVTLGLGIAEGIENALTLARVFTPVWSLIDAGNLAAFPHLYPIESLTVAVDHDAAGLKAFKTVAERWHAAGCEVRKVLVPSPGADMNSWARSVDHA